MDVHRTEQTGDPPDRKVKSEPCTCGHLLTLSILIGSLSQRTSHEKQMDGINAYYLKYVVAYQTGATCRYGM